MGKQNFYFLGQLIGCHFNQDYAYINDGEDTIEGIIQFYKKTADEQTLSELKKNCMILLKFILTFLRRNLRKDTGLISLPHYGKQPHMILSKLY